MHQCQKAECIGCQCHCEVGGRAGARVEQEDDEDFTTNLADNVAPLTELVALPLTPGNKLCCPFHEDIEPSCTIYPDHFHCFGCGEHGSRLDWLMRVEGMTAVEAVAYIKIGLGRPPTCRKMATTTPRS